MVKDRTLRAWLRESPSVCRFGRTLFVFSVLALVGLMARPLEQPAWARVKAGQPELNLAALEGALECWVVFARLWRIFYSSG